MNIMDTAMMTAGLRALASSPRYNILSDWPALMVVPARVANEIDAAFSGTDALEQTAKRTNSIDTIILGNIGKFDLVLNLASGFDSRSKRLPLPAKLLWVNVDLPEIISQRQKLGLDSIPSKCDEVAIAVDLSDTSQRNRLFDCVAERSNNVLVLTEGYLIYLNEDQVLTLSREMASRFSLWLTQYTFPEFFSQAEKQQRNIAPKVPFRFNPENGPRFFGNNWSILEYQTYDYPFRKNEFHQIKKQDKINKSYGASGTVLLRNKDRNI